MRRAVPQARRACAARRPSRRFRRMARTASSRACRRRPSGPHLLSTGCARIFCARCARAGIRSTVKTVRTRLREDRRLVTGAGADLEDTIVGLRLERLRSSRRPCTAGRSSARARSGMRSRRMPRPASPARRRDVEATLRNASRTALVPNPPGPELLIDHPRAGRDRVEGGCGQRPSPFGEIPVLGELHRAVIGAIEVDRCDRNVASDPPRQGRFRDAIPRSACLRRSSSTVVPAGRSCERSGRE